MNFEKMLKSFNCDCGKTHGCEIKHIVIEDGALSRIGEFVSPYKNILLVADQNTYKACGAEVRERLGERCADALIFEREGYLVPDEKAVAAVENKLTPQTDLIMGVGSGVIQDLCKYTSFKAGLPYHIIATAPSMDGYASVGAAMIANNMKVTYNAHVPEVILGDTEVLRNAPMDMIKAGYGDILGKFSCLNDWKLSHIVNGEYLCDCVYGLTYDMLNKTKDLGERLLKRDADAVKTLTEALAGVGIAMAYVGNSRPASGSEHHMSHFFEVTGLAENKPYFLHGIDVVYSAVYTQKLREELIRLEKPQVVRRIEKTEYEEKIRQIYSNAAEGVIELQTSLGTYDKDRLPIYSERWNEIKDVLKAAPSSTELLGYLKSVDLDIAAFEKQYGDEKIQNAIRFAKDLKDRYTVLWLYFDLFYK